MMERYKNGYKNGYLNRGGIKDTLIQKKVVEVTMEDVEKKFGCCVKIVNRNGDD